MSYPTPVCLLSHNSPALQDFRQCQSLIQKIGLPQHAFPPTQIHHESLAAKNVQRGLAAKVQDLSAAFRKKQRVYMESTRFTFSSFCFGLLLQFFLPFIDDKSRICRAPSYSCLLLACPVQGSLFKFMTANPKLPYGMISPCSLSRTLGSVQPKPHNLIQLDSD